MGLLFGAAVGAAIGLLLAPKSGAELRHQVTDSAGRWKRKAVGAYDGATDAVGDAVARSRNAIAAGREAFVDHQARASKAASSSSGVSVS
jgi:hypothetical protein